MKWLPGFTTLITLFSLCLLVATTYAAENDKPPKLFDEKGEMRVTLAGPWRTVQRQVKKDRRYPVQLTYTGSDGQTHTLAAEAAPRGITRRLRVCDFPPLKLHFDKKKVKGTEFRGNKSLKLVTYCKTNTKYEQYYIKEFIAYRIYNLITEYSFRVRPLLVDYKDSSRNSKALTRFSFLIEDIDAVAKRNGLQKLTVGTTPVKGLDGEQAANLALYQYLIGNLDWAATGGHDKNRCCHNARLIGKGKNEVPKYAIPYDFDSSGLVNAHYAAPPDKLKVSNIRQRLYRGFCAHNDKLPAAVERFQRQRANIFGLFNNDQNISKGNRKRALNYIEDFYEVLDNPKRFKREITDKCRG